MNKYHFDSFSNIPLLSLSEPESLPRIKTFTSEALSPELLYPSLKLAKQYTSLSHEIPLEDYSPKLKGEDQVLNKQSFLQHMTKEENEFLMRKLRKKPFDFGNFKHIKSLISILRKNPLSRGPSEFLILTEVFSYLPFFQKFQNDFDEETFKELLRKLRYEFGMKSRRIFNIGDMGRKFYIILSGTVLVLVPNSSNEYPNRDHKHKDNNNHEENGLLVNELSCGDSFGEIALLNSVPRTATCVCKEDTHFVVLTSECYRKIVAQYHKKLYCELLDFLNKTQVFSSWPMELKNILALHFQLQSFPLSTVLYQENDHPDYLYLIKTGFIEISQSQSKTLSQNPSIILDNFQLLKEKNPSEPKPPEVGVGLIKCTLCLLGPLEVFGDDELLSKGSRKTNAEVHSTDVLVYRIPIKSLVENVPKVYIKKLLKLNLIRWTWRHKLQQSTSKVLSDFPSSHKPLPYYISSTAFSHEEDVKTHIKTKNNEVLQALPLTFSFNYRNKAFFNGIQKYHLLSPATQKTELEKAVFPETTLIPFRKKLQALVLGLRHFRVSEELKDKLERLVHENTIKYRSNQRKEEDYHVDFLNEEEEEEKEDEKDLLAAFKGSFSRERKEKKTLNKKENPLLVLSNNLGLKLNGRGSNIKEKELFPLKNIVKGSLGINDSLKDKEKDLGHINNQIRENDRILRRKSLKNNEKTSFNQEDYDKQFKNTPKKDFATTMNLISRQKTLFPNKKSVKEFLNKPQAKKCPIIWDKKMVSFVNLSVEGDQQIKEKKVFSSLGNRLIKKRKNIRELGEKRNEFDKRKLVFLTEGMNNK